MPDYRKVAEAYFADQHNKGLKDWVDECRRSDPPIAWRRIVVQLSEMTGGVVDVAPQTLINWFGESDRELSS